MYNSSTPNVQIGQMRFTTCSVDYKVLLYYHLYTFVWDLHLYLVFSLQYALEYRIGL